MASELLFRSGMVAHLMGQTIFIFLALALYRLLKPVNQHHATLMVILVLVSIPITFLNELNHLAALRLLRQAGTGGDTSAHLQTQAMLFLNLREDGILIAQIFWGLWLLPLGFLIFRSGFLPRLLGVLLMIGGTGYLVDVTTRLLATGLPTVSQFTFIGELLLPLWLLIRGVDLERWRDASANPRMEY
jgi:hypothetical protein